MPVYYPSTKSSSWRRPAVRRSSAAWNGASMAHSPRRRVHFSNPFSKWFGNGEDHGYVRQVDNPIERFLRAGANYRRRNGEFTNPVSNLFNHGLHFAQRYHNVEFDWPVLLGVLFVLFLCSTVITASVLFTHPAGEVAQEPTPAPTAQLAVMGGQQKEADQIRILLLGSDERGDGSYRTDVIMLVVLDPNDMTISVVSFPRDLWVKVPSLWEMKINEVHQLGGFEAMADMFQANFSVKPDYYVMTNFNGFIDFIDNRGGIDVEVAQPLTDDCDLIWQRDGDCTVDPGTVHMDGASALWYVRSRHTSSDIDRLRRAQEVVSAVVKKMLNFGSLAKLTEFKSEVEENVDTNMSLEQVITLLPYARQAMKDTEKVRRYAITEDQATEWISWNGQWILQPNEKAIRALLLEAGIKLYP